ncbi:PLP-dependent aminotransferase family protein [Rothia nasimurium]|uniref:MocR-like pyridoxine biosynthesis transcription factor PdxR n=1 Tax=Rothia nasimurium TaxID=85336 RepID=UPI001F27F615|nr:PLP-dependent aminotransferase family protein [Rothia nasimurium]
MAGYSRFDQLPVSVSRSAPGSLPSQVAEQIRALVLGGFLVAGDPLPSTRALAERLNVSRGTVVFAYEQLVGEGYLTSGRGGTRVAGNLTLSAPQFPGVPASVGGAGPVQPPAGSGEMGRTSARRRVPITSPADTANRDLIDLRPGSPDTSLVASSTWRAAWRQAAATPGTAYPPAGSYELRVQLAEHLRLMRSVLRTPDDLLVTAGARDGFRLILTALRRRVRNRPLRIAVENPGYPSLHRIPLAFGHEILPIEVDEQGLNPAHLPTGPNRPDLVLIAPSHQYPLGASMPLARRLELLAWARTHDALLVEDDYDSELRYVGDPLPALASLDRPPLPGGAEAHPARWASDRVVTLGSFAKMLAPGLNLGYVVAPRHLQADLLELRADLGNPVSSVVQDAMAAFLAAGGVRRHTARMRRVYRGRREQVLTALEGLAGPQVLPMDGGLHAVIYLPGTDPARGTSLEQNLVATAHSAGVLVAPLGDYWSARAETGEGLYGLVLGFGAVSDRKLALGLASLRRVLEGYSFDGDTSTGQ